MRHAAAVSAIGLVVIAACGTSGDLPSSAPLVAADPSASPPSVLLHGVFVKQTDFPCHLSDPFVGGERVTFTGTDQGRVTEIVTGSADWIGLAADPPDAPLGSCRQVAPYEVRLPPDRAYVVEINDHRLARVTMTDLRAEGFRHTFRLPS
jgi:hypothetical protein